MHQWFFGFAAAVVVALVLRFVLPRGVSRGLGGLIHVAAWLLAAAIGAFALWTASGITDGQSGFWLIVGLAFLAAILVVVAGKMLRSILRGSPET